MVSRLQTCEYHDFLHVFETSKTKGLPPSRPCDHAIDLVPNAVKKRFPAYNLNAKEEDELKKFLKEHMERGTIRSSKSEMASPLFFVDKKDGTLRPCQDYRYLNSQTIKNAYPLPLISDLMTKLADAKWFTKFDIQWGYNNIRIKEGDQWKAAFKTPTGLYEPMVMFFGLCNSPATFQNFMNDTFQDLINKNKILVYMDDILIHAKDMRTLIKTTRQVLKIASKNMLHFKPSKCVFHTQSVEYLGHIITPGNIQPDPVKLKGIKDWPTPTTIKQVRSFLGFTNYYRRFIPNYSQLSKSLTDMTRKDTTFQWTPIQQQAFDVIKSKFLEEPILALPDPNKEFHLETDASNNAIGAILRQPHQDPKNPAKTVYLPIAYLSRKLTPAQKNYEIYDKELLAIKLALEEYNYLLLGSKFRTTLYTDHKNITYYRTPQRLTPRQMRTWQYISQFNLLLQHKPGKQLQLADALSRRPDHFERNDLEEKPSDITVFPPSLFQEEEPPPSPFSRYRQHYILPKATAINIH